MDKGKADRIIMEYQKKIFGFALKELRNMDEAEELAANIVYELYKSLITSGEVANIDGYVYRISKNCFAKFLDGKNKNKHLDLEKVINFVADDKLKKIEEEETYKIIRKEISILSKRQRTITYMHYYENMSVSQIANKLDISSGTVKWHLSDAKSKMKEEMIMVKNDNINVNPIKFVSTGHNGSPGTSGDTATMFDTRLKQNIAWSCYYKEKDINEIARDLDVPAVYVESELNKLVEWGYIDQVDNSKNPKYATNMYITDLRDNLEEKTIPLYQEAAKYLCENVFKQVFDEFDKSDNNWGFEAPESDKNFIKYTLVMLITMHFRTTRLWQDHEKFSVKRPDGGDFIAYATATDDCEHESESKYKYCGYMFDNVVNDEKEIQQIIQFNCNYTDREMSWKDNLESDWYTLNKFAQNGNDKNALQPEEYKRICDKGYIYNDVSQIVRFKSNEESLINGIENHISNLAKISNDTLDYCKKLDSQFYQLMKGYFPNRIDGLVKYNNKDVMSGGEAIPCIIEELLRIGLLKPLTDVQKKSALTIIVYRG